MTKTIMITGATAGFGKATALRFAENGYNMIITGRRKENYENGNVYCASKSADDIADAIYYCATLPAHVCINDLVITPTQQAGANHNYRRV